MLTLFPYVYITVLFLVLYNIKEPEGHTKIILVLSLLITLFILSFLADFKEYWRK